jgi:hypothetical protein
MTKTSSFSTSHDGAISESSRTSAIAGASPQQSRELLTRSQVVYLLQLTDEQVEHLINTDQIVPLRIVGEERFCSKDLSNLIDTYRFTAARRAR